MPQILVEYFIAEDNDSSEFPNAFYLEKTTPEVTLKQIRQSFPIKKGVYHFSYRDIYQNITVWMDLVDDNQAVPVRSSTIMLKVSRINIFVQLQNEVLKKKQRPKIQKVNSDLLDLSIDSTDSIQASSGSNIHKSKENSDFLSWNDKVLKSSKDVTDDIKPLTGEKTQNEWQDFINQQGVNRASLGLS